MLKLMAKYTWVILTMRFDELTLACFACAKAGCEQISVQNRLDFGLLVMDNCH